MAWAGTQRSYGSKPATRAQCLARAVNMLAYMRPDKLAALTAEELARFSGAPLHKCADMLARAKERGV